MCKQLDFEEISKRFQIETGDVLTLSHCDSLEIDENTEKIRFIEETRLVLASKTDLKDKLEKEKVSLTKKMWGSVAVFQWWICKENRHDFHKFEREFVVAYSLNGSLDEIRLAKALLTPLRDTLEDFKNGAVHSVKIKRIFSRSQI